MSRLCESSVSGRSDEGRPALSLRGGTAPDKHPKLDSRLAAASRASRERGLAAAVAEARGGGVRVQGQSVQVVIESDSQLLGVVHLHDLWGTESI